MIVDFGETCFEIFRIGLDVGRIVGLLYFDFGRGIILDGVNRDKRCAVFSLKEEFDSKAVPTGSEDTVGFVKSKIVLSVVVFKVESGTEVIRIQRGLYILTTLFLSNKCGAIPFRSCPRDRIMASVKFNQFISCNVFRRIIDNLSDSQKTCFSPKLFIPRLTVDVAV